MNLELSERQAGLLLEHLARQIARVEDELVHTEARQMQHELALETEQLRELYERLRRQVLSEPSPETIPS